MSETKKISSEELESIKKIKQEYTELALTLGELELQKSNIEKEKLRLLDIHTQLMEKETNLVNQLSTKYGNGTINVETGEITV